MEPFFAFLGIALIVGVVKYFSYKKQLLDRVAMDPENLKLEGKLSMGNEALRFGLLFIGIALGIITGAFMDKFGLFSQEIFSYLTGIFLCGGLTLIIGYFIENKNNNKSE